MAKAKDAAPDFVVPKGTRPPEIPAERLIKPRQALPYRMMVNSDDHYPIVDKYYEAALFAFARDWKPDTWLHGGDRYDLWSISTHEKEPERIYNGPGSVLQEEFDSAQDSWKEICRIAEHVHFLPGNHENRIQRLIKANMGLFGLRSFDWHKLADIPEKVRIYNYGDVPEIGGISFEHGDRIGGRMGCLHAADWVLNKRAVNTIFGHTHRVETRYRVDRRGSLIFAHNLGHGSDTKLQKYAGPNPNWQHGFAAIEFYTVGGKPRFAFHPIVVVDGRFMFGGKLYDGRKWQ